MTPSMANSGTKLVPYAELAETDMHCLGTGLGKIDKPGEGEGAIATIWEDKK